jgi:hypothetical protein
VLKISTCIYFMKTKIYEVTYISPPFSQNAAVQESVVHLNFISCFKCCLRRSRLRPLLLFRHFPQSSHIKSFSEAWKDVSIPQTVRENHRAHEAEILPHVRRGLYLQDYSHFSLDQMTIIVIAMKH